jgi:phage-related protein
MAGMSEKPMKGSLRGVMEIVSDFDGDTFRVMYTTRIGDELYVLHAFQKKSKRGAATPQHEVDLIENRLKAAKQLHAERSVKRDKR